MNNISMFFRIILIAALLLTAANPADAHERYDGNYSTIVDESGNIIYITARMLDIGDQVVTENNKRYEIYAIEDDTGIARLVGEIDLSFYNPDGNFLGEFEKLLEPAVAKAQGKGKIAIYHTHSDESYEPTDNQESIAGGGTILKVGSTFKTALEKNGLQVIHSETKHEPHDDMAYERSRRTAMNLIKNDKPDAIFDVHRDAVPPEVYKGTVNGQDVSKLQLVVGKHGPTAKQIEDYALQIKAASDKKYPGLVKGIFFAKGGDYNQDLHPRSMLIEAGAHTNDRPSAERGIAMFADVVPAVLTSTGKENVSQGEANKSAGAGAGTTGAPPNKGGTGGILGAISGNTLSGTTKSIFLIIGLVVLGTAGFLYLSTGSLKEAKGKLKQFVTTEFANFLGPEKKKREDKKEPKTKRKK